MALSPTKLQEKNDYVRLLVYGSPGVGKTTFAAGAPNPVFLDFENSTTTLRKTHPDIAVISDRKELANVGNILEYVLKPTGYDTIVIDSISSMYETILMEHMKGQKNRDSDLALFQDFRKITNVMKRVFYTLIDVKAHVVLIAHERELRDSETNKLLQVRPHLPPEVRASIERLINEVFYIEADKDLSGKVKRTVTVTSQGKILAKNRQALTESKLENPTWKDIYK